MPSLSIPKSFIADLVQRSDLVAVVKARVSLKQNGNRYVGLCPFHDEKTPSFYVHVDRCSYHCFGCGAHGDVIQFLQQYERLDFVKTIQTLAEQAGLKVPYINDKMSHLDHRKRQERKLLHESLAQVSSYYQQQLERSPVALDYFKKRGITSDMMTCYELGFAPPGWRNLPSSWLTDETRPLLQHLIQNGLVARKDHGHVYACFRERLMFPIRNTRGIVVGFGGRVLNDTVPKYLNSTFHKGEVLYGLYHIKQQRKALDDVLVVEGYMDVLSAARMSVGCCAVATLGTAITTEHVRLLLKESMRMTFCFDGDAAGQKAAWKALEICLPFMHEQLDIGFLFLPKGEDPDTVIQEQGPEYFQHIWQRQRAPLADVFFDHLTASKDLTVLHERAYFVKQAVQLLRLIPDNFFKQLMWQRLSYLTGLDHNALQVMTDGNLKRFGHERQKKFGGKHRVQSMHVQHLSFFDPIQKTIALLLHHPELHQILSSEGELQAEDVSLPHLNTLRHLLKLILTHCCVDVKQCLACFPDGSEKNMLKRLANQPLLIDIHGLKDELKDLLGLICCKLRQQRIELLLKKMQKEGLQEDEKRRLQTLIVQQEL